MAITTAMATQFKADLFQAKHCFNATITKTANGGSGAFTLTALANVTGLAVGMAASGTNVASGAVIASIDSTTQVTLSKANTGVISTGTITFTGDVFKIVLIKVGPAGTYGAASVNYSDITGNSDEVSGTGYTATGAALTNVTPTASGTTALTDFSPDPSWTSATFSTTGCMLVNTSQRGETANRCVSTHDFGGTQSVASGTFTAVMPSADASNAILRIA